MELPRLLACTAAVWALAACSSKGGSVSTPQGAVDAGDAGQAGNGDAATPDAGCPASKTCGSSCCDDTQVCAADFSGNIICQQTCTTSGTCPNFNPCCTRASADAAALCMPDPDIPQACLCEQSSDCTTQSCAPAVDSSGMPTGPYTCVPNDNQAYQGCAGNGLCPSPYCCVTDPKGNQFCALPCDSDATCGSAHCKTYDFSASSCTGKTKACGI